MSRNLFIPFVAVMLSNCMTTASYADDTALYAEPAPADAAFVRFIGFEPGANVEFVGENFIVPHDNATSYIAVSASRLTDVSAGLHISVFSDETGELQRIDEPARASRSKVHLFVVNSGDAPVNLATSDGAMAVLENVMPGSAMSRAVNPVAASLAVFGSDEQSIENFDVTLRRGQNLSFIIGASGAYLIENSFGPVLK